MNIMINDAKFSALFRTYVDGNASPDQELAFFELASQPEWQDLLIQLVDAEMQKPQIDNSLTDLEKGEILTHIYRRQVEAESTVLPKRHATFTLWKKLTAVAAAIALITTGVYLYRPFSLPFNNETSVIVKDVAPGRNAATLTLANGKVISLSEQKSGIVMDADGLKYDDGTLLSLDSLEGNSAEMAMLKASTPRGGTYQVVLPDGTHVWLNAASSISYPMAFRGKERRVKITGEVYFEVVHNAAQPFLVEADGQLIEDIGTSFNVNAYRDENLIKTTLVEGAVKLSSNNMEKILSPGQQAQIAFPNGDGINVVSNADIDGIIAWKNGLFKFNKASLQDVMRQLSRWYNIDVAYKGKIPERNFTGEITRNVNLSEILDLLRFLNLDFTIQQHNEQLTITVTQ